MSYVGVVTVQGQDSVPQVWVTGAREDQSGAWVAGGAKAVELLGFRLLFAEHGQDMSDTERARELVNACGTYVVFRDGDGAHVVLSVSIAELCDHVRPMPTGA